jgi:hypothetical protein
MPAIGPGGFRSASGPLCRDYERQRPAVSISYAAVGIFTAIARDPGSGGVGR